MHSLDEEQNKRLQAILNRLIQPYPSSPPITIRNFLNKLKLKDLKGLNVEPIIVGMTAHHILLGLELPALVNIKFITHPFRTLCHSIAGIIDELFQSNLYKQSGPGKEAILKCMDQTAIMNEVQYHITLGSLVLSFEEYGENVSDIPTNLRHLFIRLSSTTETHTTNLPGTACALRYRKLVVYKTIDKAKHLLLIFCKYTQGFELDDFKALPTLQELLSCSSKKDSEFLNTYSHLQRRNFNIFFYLNIYSSIQIHWDLRPIFKTKQLIPEYLAKIQAMNHIPIITKYLCLYPENLDSLMNVLRGVIFAEWLLNNPAFTVYQFPFSKPGEIRKAICWNDGKNEQYLTLPKKCHPAKLAMDFVAGLEALNKSHPDGAKACDRLLKDIQKEIGFTRLDLSTAGRRALRQMLMDASAMPHVVAATKLF